jgi:bifunctional DNase/RNase
MSAAPSSPGSKLRPEAVGGEGLGAGAGGRCGAAEGTAARPSEARNEFVRVRVFSLGPHDAAAGATLLTLLPEKDESDVDGPRAEEETELNQGQKLCFRMSVSMYQAAAIRDMIVGRFRQDTRKKVGVQAQLSGGGKERTQKHQPSQQYNAEKRPSMHTLFETLAHSTHSSISEAAITHVASDVFVASIYLSPNSSASAPAAPAVPIILDARPSDAIAIAFQANAPLYLHRDLLETWSVSVSAIHRDAAAGLCECLPPFLPAAPLSTTSSSLSTPSPSSLNPFSALHIQHPHPSLPFPPGLLDALANLDDEVDGEDDDGDVDDVTAHDRFRAGHFDINFEEIDPDDIQFHYSATSAGPVHQYFQRSAVDDDDDDNDLRGYIAAGAFCSPELQRLAGLWRDLDLSVRCNRFKDAARIRDEIDALCPIDRLRAELAAAVASERYTEAAQLRDAVEYWEETLELWESPPSSSDALELEAILAASTLHSFADDEADDVYGSAGADDDEHDDPEVYTTGGSNTPSSTSSTARRGTQATKETRPHHELPDFDTNDASPDQLDSNSWTMPDDFDDDSCDDSCDSSPHNF